MIRGKAIPAQAYSRPESWSLRTDCLYPQGNIPATNFNINEKFQWQHRESNPQLSGLQRSASTNCASTPSVGMIPEDNHKQNNNKSGHDCRNCPTWNYITLTSPFLPVIYLFIYLFVHSFIQSLTATINTFLLTLNIPRGALWGPQRVFFCDPAVKYNN